MRYYIIAGEASGDLHGSNLVISLFQEDPEAVIRAWGGDLMEAAGATVVKHYRNLAFMGFVEVLSNLPTIFKNFKFCKKEIIDFQPDVIILIDYPGFNLRMAKWAFANQFKVFYYISPQLWAWKTGRVEIVKKYVQRMFVILPFEVPFYKKHGVEVDYLGHPLIDVIKNFSPSNSFHRDNNLSPDKPIIALLPGSRKQEIDRMLDVMLQVKDQFENYQFVIAGAPSIDSSFYKKYTDRYPSVYLAQNQTYNLLAYSKAALVTSGTATLETALFDVPQIVCYSGNWLSFQLAKRLVNKDLEFIAMANLIAGKKVVEELIQQDFNKSKLVKNLKKILSEPGQSDVLSGYKTIQSKLDKSGASANAAKLMVQYLKK